MKKFLLTLSIFSITLALQSLEAASENATLPKAPPLTILPNLEEQQLHSHSSLTDFYALKKEGKTSEAKSELEKVLAKNPNIFPANLEMAYILINEEKYRKALYYLLVAYKLSGEEPRIALQIAYTYDQLDANGLAIDYYTIARNGDDPEISAKAQKELDAKDEALFAGNATKKCETFLDRQFLEFYADGIYFDRFDNFVVTIDSKMGFDIDKCRRHEAYLKFWHVRDTKSAGGTTPAIFTDNVMIISAGYRYRLKYDKYYFLYAEYGEAYDLIYQDRSTSRGDFRGGLIVYDDWDKWFKLPFSSRYCVRSLGDFDLNFSYYTRYEYWIGYATLKEGLSLYRNCNTELNCYLRQFVAWDTKGEFFNNVYELGPTIELYPFKKIPFKIYASYVQGYYYRNAGSSANPYGHKYTDRRIQAVIWSYF